MEFGATVMKDNHFLVAAAASCLILSSLFLSNHLCKLVWRLLMIAINI